jgi:hypothetical protein
MEETGGFGSLDDAGAEGLGHRVGPGRDVEPLVEALDVRLQGLNGDTDLLADLAVPERSPALALCVRECRMGWQAPVEGPD